MDRCRRGARRRDFAPWVVVSGKGRERGDPPPFKWSDLRDVLGTRNRRLFGRLFERLRDRLRSEDVQRRNIERHAPVRRQAPLKSDLLRRECSLGVVHSLALTICLWKERRVAAQARSRDTLRLPTSV